VEAHPPVVGLVTCQTSAVNAGYTDVSKDAVFELKVYLHC
jgi:hypothetical protein